MFHAFMTGNIMKSELLDSDRLNRKRMSKGTQLANGTTHPEDEESMVRQATLAAALHDHISCAKPPDFCKIQESRDERAAIRCETDHIYANSSEAKATRDESQQLQQLKEMVLIQLELIQHQQEQLLKKDRQLQVVNQEKEALKTRLERMERRVALMKQRQEERSDDESAQETNQSSLSGSNLSRSNSSSSTSGNRDKCISSFLSSGLKRSENRESRQQRAAVRSIKRRYASQSRTAAKRRFASASLSSNSRSSSQPKGKSSRSRSSSADSSNASTQNQRTSSSWSQVSRRSKGSQVSPRGKAAAALRKQSENILRTDKLYYTPVGETKKLSDVPVKESLIEVPSWRYHPVTSCYQLEGTENIDDEVFSKRHFKLEVDERRRKRWDIQRIREQRLNEKLRKGRSADKDQGDDGRRWNGEIRSFYPDPKGISFVEITNTVPVVAFGSPVLKFQSCEFSLPWFDPVAREKRENQQKQGRQRSCSGTKRGT